MEKEIFVYLYKFSFNGKKFAIFWNKKTGCFPLELIEGALVYSDYNDYISIFKELEIKPSLQVNLYDYSTSSDKPDNNPSNRRNKTKYFSFRPLVRAASIGLITFAMALSMSGCALSNSYDQSDYNHVEAVIEQAEENGKIVEYNSELGMFFVKEYQDTENNRRVIFVSDMDQLRQYFPEEKPHPTFDDVRETIANSKTISRNVKNILNTITDNLEKNAPDLDLFLFRHNIKRLFVTEYDTPYISGKTSGVLANYNPETGILTTFYKNLELSRYGHECFHIATSLIEDIDGSDVTINYSMCPITYFSFYDSIIHNNSYEEGAANLFALLAADKEQFETDNVDNSYVPMTEGIKVVLTSVGWSVEDLVSHDAVSFLLAMKDKGIEDPTSSLSLLARIYNNEDNTTYDPKAYGLEDWVYDYALEIGKYKINNKQNDFDGIYSLFDNSAYDGDVVYTYCVNEDGESVMCDMYDKKATKKAVKDELQRLLEIRKTPLIGPFLSIE